MAKPRTLPDVPMLSKQWELPSAATLGSAVRAKGILLEMRARLPQPLRKALDIVAGTLTLELPKADAATFRAVAEIVTRGLVGIESLPVIPREIEDILSIKTSERHRWLKDGRLPSAGTRTVRLAGRAKQITFHVFDPRVVRDLLDSDQMDAWREEDVETRRENRQRALWNAKLKRAEKAGKTAPVASEDDPGLAGWAAFMREGLLR
ncbi:hypothetical protein [Devosia beringensis]|uniref:hypothetical protein n=1 Tax=Devosia beringensis TaxID=2657486 RepID=UPI00186B744F|nr:hypothetical protein [Devosia beringensis]